MISALNNSLDFVFSPLLNLGVFWTVLIISFLLSVLITVIYKYTTDQNLMKQLKEEIKSLQKESKTLQNHPEKFKEVQSQMMKINMRVMSESFKPMLYYFLPIILIFGWMNANLYYQPLTPGELFNIDIYNKELILKNYEGLEFIEEKIVDIIGNEAKRFVFKGNLGEYLVVFENNGEEYQKTVLINEKKYSPPEETIKEIKIVTGNKSVILFNLGFMELGWLGTYIISSIIFSALLRKAMNVY